jgi:hypothetical protein
MITSKNALTLPFKIAIRPGGSPAVEAHGQVARFPLENGGEAWLAGQVDAVRARNGEWQAPPEPRALPIDPNNPEAAAERMEGRFVLVVSDGAGRFWIGADRHGRADIYVSRDARTIATDLSLMPDPAAGGFDQAAWAHTLVAYGYRAPKRHTPYRNVVRLGVGESISIAGGRATVNPAAFTPEPQAPLTTRTLNEYADRFIDAIRVRGSRHGNVVFLSSGWDSTSILAALVDQFGPRKVRAVIGRMRYSERAGIINQFEIDRARAVADYYRVPLEIVEFDYRRDGAEWMDSVRPLFAEHHIASITGINHYALSRHVAATTGGDETIFAGEISDGAHNLGFSQFASVFHPSQGFREYADKMAGYLFGPTFLTQLQEGVHDSDAVYAFYRARLGEAALDQPAPTPAGRAVQLLASLFLRWSRFPLHSLANVKMLTPSGAEQYASTMESAYLREAGERVTPETLYAWYLHLYDSFHWQGSTVATLSLVGDALGLRMALPFWDTRLLETLSAMPEEAGRGLDLHPTKYPLKWTLEHRLDYPFHLQVGPHSYLYDVDPSFSHSAELAYASSFAPVFKDALKAYPHRGVLDAGWFDMTYLDGVVARYLEGSEVRGGELNDLMALALTASIGWSGR